MILQLKDLEPVITDEIMYLDIIGTKQYQYAPTKEEYLAYRHYLVKYINSEKKLDDEAVLCIGIIKPGK